MIKEDNLKQMKADLRIPNKVYTRLKYLFDSATSEERTDGLNWYDRANDFTTDLAIRYGYSIGTVCAVTSALSPAVSWQQNKKDAISLLRAVAMGETDVENIPASTYGQQVNKALKIAWTQNTDYIGNGLKTVSFALNIQGIQDSSVCTVDRHMLGASVGSRSTEHQRIAVTNKRYFDISTQLKRLARNRNVLPKQAQAIIWLTYRRRLGLVN